MYTTMEPTRAVLTSRETYVDYTDEQLLGEYTQTGNRATFEELVRRYERELYNYLRRYLGDAEAAEDAFQLTFLHVHLKCGYFQPHRKLRPWLYTVATKPGDRPDPEESSRHKMVSLNRPNGKRSVRRDAVADGPRPRASSRNRLNGSTPRSNASRSKRP